MASVFLSYDRDDAVKARTIAIALEKSGHSVWWDNHISGGSQYAKEIEQALNGADVVVVLWTPSSIESPWVRDEAGAGRDRVRLVPLSLEGTVPPLGFRQFQAIDLGSWKGRGKVPRLAEILEAIDRQAIQPGLPEIAPSPLKSRTLGHGLALKIALLIGLAFVVLGIAIWRPWERSPSGPAVAVIPADASPSSRAMAREVLATLGTLQANSGTDLRLIDDQTNEGAELRLSVGAANGNGKSRGTITLASSGAKAVLWSRQVDQPNGQHANLEQAVAYAAMTALACTDNDSHATANLRTTDLRAYLSACVASEEVIDPQPLVAVFRNTASAAPAFAPAWANLLMAETHILANLREEGETTEELRETIGRDLLSARNADPDMPQAIVAEMALRPPRAFFASIASIDQAVSANPNSATLLNERSSQLSNVGRNSEALSEIERAVQLKPYSPTLRERYIMNLAASGAVDKARTEIAVAKQLWPDAASIAVTENVLDLRYGDFETAWRTAGLPIDGGITGYFKILRDPSDANIDAWVNLAKTHPMLHPHRIFILQALGPLKRVDQLYEFLDQWPIDKDLEGLTYILFQPWTANVRRDPRFMALARRLGLLDYWEKSGKWPDFCSEPDMPYDCKKEAAKLKA